MLSAPRVVQVTNVAPATTKEQLKTLFGFLGRIDDLVIYPTAEATNVTSKVCYVKFAYADDVSVALHLTNTVFIDRALNVVTVPDGRIPDEKTAMSSSYSLSLATSEGTKGDEVERTIYIANLDAAVAPETLMQFFGQHAGEVKYARMAGEEGVPVRAAFIEFSEKSSVSRALALTGQLLGSRPVTVVPSTTAIVKSVSGLEGASSTEIEEALRKVNEAQPLISAAVDSEGSRRKRSRSRSKSRRSRSRSHSRRSRSHRSRSPKRSRSRSPRFRQRSKSKSPKRHQSSSKSKDRRRERSRSKSPKRGRSQRSRSRSKGRRYRGDADKGGYSPSHSERDGYGNSKRVSKDDRSQESSRQRSRSSRSKSPVPYSSSCKDKDWPRSSVDYDSRKEQEADSYHEGRQSRKSGEKRDHGDRKSSSKHRHRQDEQVRESKKVTKRKTESDEEDDRVDEDDERRSAAEESNDDERNAGEARSESDQSDADERERKPSDDDSSEAAHANLSRMDMDVESD